MRAEDQLARLDERARRSPVTSGFIERGHFFDAAASMWVAGELVHVEDLVLHDAHMDVRAPTHELVIAHSILRTRRRIAAAEPGWALSDVGLATLRGQSGDVHPAVPGEGNLHAQHDDDDVDDHEAVDPLSDEFAEFDAVLARSERVLTQHAAAPPTAVSVKGKERDPLVYDQDWDEAERLARWQELVSDTAGVPPSLAAALAWEEWETLEPLQRQHWLGAQLAASILRSERKVGTHLLGINAGLKSISRERRRSPVRTTRLTAFLDALSSAAEAGMKELDRLVQAKDLMERRLRNRRSSSSLPSVIELVLSRPLVSAAMIAKEVKISPRGALNLISELGVREMTGRGRYRAWGIT
nr:RHE_PE00001 family protein [Mesorhizobium sp. SARCC-RB16n]